MPYKSQLRLKLNILLVFLLLLSSFFVADAKSVNQLTVDKLHDNSNLPQCDFERCTGTVPSSFQTNTHSLTIADKRTRGSNSQLTIIGRLLLADVDADGIADFLQYTNNNIFITKTDFEQTKILHLTASIPILHVITGDFHGNHYDQVCIVVADNSLGCHGISPGRRELWWWFSQGSFVEGNDATIVGDFDGNGRDDILVYPFGRGGNIRLYTINDNFFFEEMPNWVPGNLGGSLEAGLQFRAGDFNGDGRSDIAVVNKLGQVSQFVSVFDGSHNTFWWAFTTSENTVSSDEEFSVARIDDNAIDDVVLHNKKTGETRFFRMEFANVGLPSLSDVQAGQISTVGNSRLYWGAMHGGLDEPGATNREDALIYDLTNRLFIRSDARWDGNRLTYSWAYTQAPPRYQFTLQMEKIRVEYQDDGVLGGGDEPYLIVVAFRSRFKTPNSTFVSWNQHLEDDWANGVEAGDERDVPAIMGRIDLPDITLTTMDDVASGRMFPELVGALVLAMESDNTPFGDIRNKINRDLIPAMDAELRRLIENGELDLANLEGPALQQAIDTVESAVKTKFWEGLALWIASLGDPDNKIGKHLFAYLTVAPDLQKFVPTKQDAELTFGLLQNQQFNLNNNPIIFEGEGSKYRFSALVNSTGTDWVHQDPANCTPANQTIFRSYLPLVTKSGGSSPPPMTKSLKVLQYNVQFLTPWEGKPLGDDHWPNTPERAKNIGKAIACYDVVVLNETINPQRRQEILDAMNAEAPKCGKPDLIPGDSYFAFADGPDVEGALPTNASAAVGKLFSNPGKPIFGDELMIISRLPIIETNAQVYKYAINQDRLTAKGVLHARLQGGNAFSANTVDVFATHLQAADANIRTCQVNQLAEYIGKHSSPQNTVLVLGDFNIDGAVSSPTDVNSEYSRLTQSLTFLSNGLSMEDIGRHLTTGTNHDDNPEVHRKRRIDYIFASTPGGVVHRDNVRIFDWPDPTQEKPTLSDHAAVDAVVHSQ